MALLADMTVRIGANITSLEAGLTRAQARVKDFGSKTENTRKMMRGVGIAGAAMGAGIAVGLGMAAKKGIEFDAKMSKVAALTGATGKKFDALREQALKLGADTSFSASQAADGMANLGAAGLGTKQIIAAMPGVLDAAAASGEDLAAVSEIMVTTMSGFGLAAKDSAHIADVLAQGANESTASIADLGETFKYVAPVAKATGVSLERTAAMASIMANAGIKGGQAGTSLRMALTRLVAVPPMKAMDKVGDISPKLRDIWKSAAPVPQKLSAMSSEFKKLDGDQKAAAAAAIFGTEAMSGMLSVMDAGPAQIDALTKKMNEADGSAKKMATTMLDNLGGDLEAFKGSVESAQIALSAGLSPALRVVTQHATALVNKFNGLSPSMQRNIAIAAAVAAAVLLIGGTALVVVAAVTPLIAAAGALGAALTPILIAVAVVAAIIALGVAFYKLYQSSETVRAGVKRAWDGIKSGVMSVVNSLRATISTWGGWLKTFWAANGASITAAALKIWSGIATFIGGYLKVISGVIKTVLAVLRGDWSGAWAGLKQVVSGAMQMVRGILMAAKAYLPAVLRGAWALIKAGASVGWAGIKAVVMGVVTKLPGLIKGALSGLVGILAGLGRSAGNALADAIKEAVNKVISRWNNFELPGIKVKGKSVTPAIGTPNISTWATGGFVRGPGTGTSDSILARLSNGEAVIPARQAQRHADLVNALIDGTLPGFAGGLRAKKKRPKPPPKRVAVDVGNANTNLNPARFDADQSDAALNKKKDIANQQLADAIAAQKNALELLPRARYDLETRKKAYENLKNKRDRIIGKNSAARRLALKPGLDRAKALFDQQKAHVKGLEEKSAKNAADRAGYAQTIAQLESQLAPEVEKEEKPLTPLESMRALLDSGESVAGLAMATAEGTADTKDDETAKSGLASFFANKASTLAAFLAGPGSGLKMDEQTSIRNDIASSLRSAAQYNESEGAGVGGADPSTGPQGGGGSSSITSGRATGGGGGGGSDVQVNTTGGGAGGVGYVPDGALHPVFFGANQLNDLGWDGVSTHGVKIMSVLGWDEAEDAQSAVDNRAGQDGEIARELLMGGSTVQIKGILSGATLEDLYANRRVLKGKLQPSETEAVLKMPDRATAGPFATVYSSAMGGYLRKTGRVVQSVTWGNEVGPYAHTFEVTIRCSDPRRFKDVDVTESTGSITTGGGVEAPVEAPVGFTAADGGQAIVNNDGDYEAPFVATIYANGAAVVNPIIEDLAGSWRIVTDGLSLGTTDWLEIDVQNRTVLLNGTSSRFQYIDFAQTIWGLLPEGASTVRLRGSSVGDPSYASITFRPAYL